MDNQHEDLSLKLENSSETSFSGDVAVQQEVAEDQNFSSEAFNKQLETLSSVQEQIALCLVWMEQALKQASGVSLKLFWSIRKKAAVLFQTIEESDFRAESWKRYTALTEEARAIKSYQPEEDSFVVNQIDLAISCLEKDVETFCQEKEFSKKKIDDKHCLNITALNHRGIFYQQMHASLVWLNSFSTRIIELRKELTRVGMRMKLKSQFFQRLSSAGNIVFPKRKEYINSVSQAFLDDVRSFVETHFVHKDKRALKRSVFFLKQEIKNLQQAAKSLFVTSSVFGETRAQLSQCWDQLKGVEDEVRSEQNRLKEQSADNVKVIREMLSKLSALFSSDATTDVLRQEVSLASKEIKSATLIHDDVLTLKKELKPLLDQLKGRQDQEEQKHQEKVQKENEARKTMVADLEKNIDAFVEECKSGKASAKDNYAKLQASLAKLTFVSSAQKVVMSNRLALGLKYINEFLEEQLLASSEHSEKLIAMRQILSQRLERRKELKIKLDKDKQLLGSSGLDFESAFQFSSIVEEDRRALEELEAKILELKQEIQRLL